MYTLSQLKCACFALGIILMVPKQCLAHTETISLSPVADTSLFELAPDNNLGGGNTFVAGTNGRLAKSRALIKFDIAKELPTNAAVVAVTLTATVASLPGDSNTNETTFSLHRLVQAWGEGNKTGNNGAPGSTGEATWNAREAPSTLWNQPGAGAPEDFTAAPSASISVMGLGSYNFESPNLITDVQGWLAHPDKNFGWVLVNGNEGTSRSARRFSSREGDAPPSLLIQYAIQSDEFRIEGAQLIDKYMILHLNFPAGKGYSVQFRDSLSTDTWKVLQTFPAEMFFQHYVLADPRGTNPQRFYRVEVLSGGAPSNQPIGR